MTWTHENISVVRELKHAGYSMGEIASQVGKTRNAVIGKLSRLGLSAETQTPMRVWTLKEKELLTRHWAQNVSGRVIGLELRRTQKSVYLMAEKLGLVKRTAPARIAMASPVAPRPKRREPVKCTPVTLEHRTGCCWIDGKHSPALYCNNAIETRHDGKTWQYCDAHKSMMFESKGKGK